MYDCKYDCFCMNAMYVCLCMTMSNLYYVCMIMYNNVTILPLFDYMYYFISIFIVYFIYY